MFFFSSRVPETPELAFSPAKMPLRACITKRRTSWAEKDPWDMLGIQDQYNRHPYNRDSYKGL